MGKQELKLLYYPEGLFKKAEIRGMSDGVSEHFDVEAKPFVLMFPLEVVWIALGGMGAAVCNSVIGDVL